MGAEPDDLEAVDVTDREAVSRALAAAAARIRELERDGVRAVGGTVAEMLDQAASAGDEMLEQARTDAAATRETAEKAAAEMKAGK